MGGGLCVGVWMYKKETGSLKSCLPCSEEDQSHLCLLKKIDRGTSIEYNDRAVIRLFGYASRLESYPDVKRCFFFSWCGSKFTLSSLPRKYDRHLKLEHSGKRYPYLVWIISVFFPQYVMQTVMYILYDDNHLNSILSSLSVVLMGVNEGSLHEIFNSCN